MDILFTGFRRNLEARLLMELFSSEAQLSKAQAASMVERIVSIPAEEIECRSAEVAMAVEKTLDRLGWPCEAHGCQVAFTGWRFGSAEGAFSSLLEEVGDVSPMLADTIAAHLADGPVVLLSCLSEASARSVLAQADGLGAVCQLTETPFEDA